VGMTPSNERDLACMREALRLARAAGAAGEVPVGAVLTDREGRIVASAHNRPIAEHDPTAHAELVVLRAAGAALGNYRLPGTTLYVTLEPCVMCTGAMIHARIARLVFAAEDPRAGAAGSVFSLLQDPRLNHRVETCGGVLAAESAEMLRAFFAARR
jgi:tRNA(adenine34) deaminase